MTLALGMEIGIGIGIGMVLVLELSAALCVCCAVVCHFRWQCATVAKGMNTTTCKWTSRMNGQWQCTKAGDSIWDCNRNWNTSADRDRDTDWDMAGIRNKKGPGTWIRTRCVCRCIRNTCSAANTKSGCEYSPASLSAQIHICPCDMIYDKGTCVI